MGHEFSGINEVELDATPEQVWEAIATGPGIDSWFMGRNEVQPSEGGAVRTMYGCLYNAESAVTTWEPLKRFGHRTDTADDGRFMAYEYLIEGREQGTTVLRMVVSGFLPGDDWEAEYDAMLKGGALFFHTLVEYLTHFAGRTATPVTLFGPPVADWPRAWSVLRRELSLGDIAAGGPSNTVAEGEHVRFTPDGLDPIEGVVYFANPHTLGVRTPTALYRFLQGFQGGMHVGHHIFTADRDVKEVEQGWQAWLDRLFAPETTEETAP